MSSTLRLFLGLSSFLVAGCAPPSAGTPYPSEPPIEGEPVAAQPSADTVSFRGRDIRLAPFLSGFPYSSIDVDLEHGVMMFLERGDTYTLRAQMLAPAPDEG
ncbi:MAG: hypothetical protein ACPHRO_01735, partial [Nannocystaceae bacterium]